VENRAGTDEVTQSERGARIPAARSGRAAIVGAGHHALGERAKHVFQHGGRQRFREVTVESGVSRLSTILFLPPSGDGGDVDVIEPGSSRKARATA
jgi:hypothetical protein